MTKTPSSSSGVYTRSFDDQVLSSTVANLLTNLGGIKVTEQRSDLASYAHSPYILTSVNALYCAGKVIRDFPNLTKKVHDIVGNGCEIIPEKITALKLNKDTSVQELIDKEFEEINTEMIDEISDKINEKYTELFYLLSESEA